MKLKHIAAAAFALLLLGGCSQSADQLSPIGMDGAVQQAASAAGVSAESLEGSTVSQQQRDGTEYYHVEFTANGQQYQYDVDALSGAVIRSGASAPKQPVEPSPTVTEPPAPSPSTAVETPALSQPAPTASPAAPDPAAGVSAAPSAPPQPSQTPAPSTQPSPLPSNPVYDNPRQEDMRIEVSTAKQVALTHCGLAPWSVTFTECKLDHENGCQFYDITFCNDSGWEYRYQIDCYSGVVLSHSCDTENHHGYHHGEAHHAGGTCSPAQAKANALALVPGASPDHIVDFEIHEDDGRLIYEGEIVYNGVEYEFEIDGYSGAILEWEAEPVHG